MKVLAIIGSPKGKGSGYRIVKMIEDRMKAMAVNSPGEQPEIAARERVPGRKENQRPQADGVEFEYLLLKDAYLKPCTGCYTCLAKGEDKCPLEDDRAGIEQKLLAADGVILSSPMYVLNVSGLMANFIDRFAYANHRPRFHRQKVLTVVNMGGDSPKTALKLLRYALGGARVIHELGIATPPWPQTERAIAKKEHGLDVAAGKFYQACLDTSLPRPTLHDLVVFLFRQKGCFICRQYLPADYAYYSGKTYYYETKINPAKAALANGIVRVMMNRMKDTAPGNIPWP